MPEPAIQLPDLQGGQFPLTGRTQLMLDVVNGRFNLVDADRALQALITRSGLSSSKARADRPA